MPHLQKTLNEEMVFILERQESILESTKTESGDYILEGIAAVFGQENNNNRIYEEAEYLPHLDYLKDKIKQNRLVGELDHPKDFDISLKNLSHIITGLDYDQPSRKIKIKIKLFDTPAGKIAKNLVDAGVPLSISSRAAGAVGPDKRVSIKKIFTYDLVADPGFSDAQLERVYESAGYNQVDIESVKTNSVVNNLECLNESFGLEKNSNTKIYKIENTEEFEKIMNTVNKSDNKNKSVLMENNNEFVTAQELDEYSKFLKKEMESMKLAIAEAKEQKVLVESDNLGKENEALLKRVDKLEKYSKYLAENLNTAIKYGDYLAENLEHSISYSKYLAENLDKNISYSKYLAENVDKGISYSEYVAEKLDVSIEYAKYLAEKVEHGIQYSEYIGEMVDDNIAYSEYLGENLDKDIAYSEYLAEKLKTGIEYSEYIGENLNKSIEYSNYLSENVNTGFQYSEYLSEKLRKNISYSEYIVETINNKLEDTNNNITESAKISANAGLNESGFAGNYESLDSRIDKIIESVKTQKTDLPLNEGINIPAETQKAEETETKLEESNEVKKTGVKFIDEMPEEHKEKWEALSEGHKSSIIAQSNFYNLDTPYQIRNFWSTRQLGASPIGVQKLNENENAAESTLNAGYGSEYLEQIANALEQKFQKR